MGHAYSALLTDRWAKDMGGIVLLRIEDIDTKRCRPEFVAGVFEDLQWLGLRYPEPVRVQSQHFDDYRKAAETLKSKDLLYPCFCSRSEIRAASDGGTDPEGAPLYPGTCKHRYAAKRTEKLVAGVPVQWRIDMGKAIETAGEIFMTEAMPTPQAAPMRRIADPVRWGDVVLVRKDTPTSYHISVVVDDALQGVTHVTRGMDLYAATDIHVLLQKLLGLATPIYTHHALVTDEAKEKLSKSKGSESLADLRATGWSATDVKAALGF
ncbi:glutamyl-Q tRNA(Asp) synthetase [Pelagibacterium luteolum]|uniref:Glutamyl-Q tRNA(Asp) synthetase n=2 Tax=Pelagibacterium luteolum TaxID=440168 RepID=A0A1G7RSW6_9HYPH|nr:glutamyl-Q tRNA(Asp) synthetase [Pelagibacterium luteolum]